MPAYRNTDYRIIQFTGDDCEVFLQGQLSCDVSTLNQHWSFGGLCTPKGRLYGLLILWQQGDRFVAMIPSSICESLLRRLRMYVLRSRVDITDISEQRTLVSADRNSSNELIEKYGLPLELDSTSQQEKVATFNEQCAHLCIAGISLFIFNRDDNSDKNNIAENTTTNNQHLQDAFLSNGYPQIFPESAELFIPQMVNLDLLDGISFQKGCYTGQEIVARMHYLGSVKQRMQLYCLNDNRLDGNPELALTPEQLIPGKKVFADQQCDNAIGNIVASNSTLQRALIVVRLTHDDEVYIDQTTTYSKASTQPTALPQQESDNS